MFTKVPDTRLWADKFTKSTLHQIESFTSLKSSYDGSGPIGQMQLKSTFKYSYNIDGQVFLIKENNGSIFLKVRRSLLSLIQLLMRACLRGYFLDTYLEKYGHYI